MARRKDFSKYQRSKLGKYVLTDHDGNVVIATNDKRDYDQLRTEYIKELKSQSKHKHR